MGIEEVSREVLGLRKHTEELLEISVNELRKVMPHGSFITIGVRMPVAEEGGGEWWMELACSNDPDPTEILEMFQKAVEARKEMESGADEDQPRAL